VGFIAFFFVYCLRAEMSFRCRWAKMCLFDLPWSVLQYHSPFLKLRNLNPQSHEHLEYKVSLLFLGWSPVEPDSETKTGGQVLT
jgi:hypothetical protein